MEGIVCFIICFGTSQPAPVTPATDTYCATYEQIVRSKDDLSVVKGLPKEVRNRIQGNDLDYLCNCKGLGSAACRSVSTRK